MLFCLSVTLEVKTISILEKQTELTTKAIDPDFQGKPVLLSYDKTKENQIWKPDY